MLLSLSGTPFCPLTQILQNGPPQLPLLVCSPALLALSGGPFWPLSRPNPSKRTSPALPRIITSMFLYTHRHGNLITRELAVGLFSFLSLVLHFVRWADQMLQSGPRHLGLLGCAPCAPSGGSFWPLSSPNPPKRTSPARSAWLCSLLSLWWSVLAAQQPKSSKTDLASLVCLAVLLALPLVGRFGLSAAQIFQNGPCSPSGGPFEPLSSPNPSKRTCPTLPLAVGAGQGRTFNLQVKGLALCRLSYTSLAGNDLKITGISRQDLTESNRRKQTARKRESRHRYNLCVQWGRWKSRRSLSLSLPGAPFCQLSGPNPPKRTSPAWSAGLCSLLSLWWSVLAAQQPKSSKTDLPCSSNLIGLCPFLSLVLRFVRWAAQILQNGPRQVCLAVVRFGRSAAQILQNGPRQLGLFGCAPCSPSGGPFGRSAAQILQNGLRQLGLLGCAPCSPSGGPFWPLSSPNPSKRTSPTLPRAVGAGQGQTLDLQVKGLALCRLS